MITFKLAQSSTDTLRRLTFETTPTWLQLSSRIEQLFNIPADSVACSFIDVDGDEVTLSTAGELDEFYVSSDFTPTGIRFAVRDLRVLRQPPVPPRTPVTNIAGTRESQSMGDLFDKLRIFPDVIDEEYDNDWERVGNSGTPPHIELVDSTTSLPSMSQSTVTAGEKQAFKPSVRDIESDDEDDDLYAKYVKPGLNANSFIEPDHVIPRRSRSPSPESRNGDHDNQPSWAPSPGSRKLDLDREADAYINRTVGNGNAPPPPIYSPFPSQLDLHADEPRHEPDVVINSPSIKSQAPTMPLSEREYQPVYRRQDLDDLVPVNKHNDDRYGASAIESVLNRATAASTYNPINHADRIWDEELDDYAPTDTHRRGAPTIETILDQPTSPSSSVPTKSKANFRRRPGVSTMASILDQPTSPSSSVGETATSNVNDHQRGVSTMESILNKVTPPTIPEEPLLKTPVNDDRHRVSMLSSILNRPSSSSSHNPMNHADRIEDASDHGPEVIIPTAQLQAHTPQMTSRQPSMAPTNESIISGQAAHDKIALHVPVVPSTAPAEPAAPPMQLSPPPPQTTLGDVATFLTELTSTLVTHPELNAAWQKILGNFISGQYGNRTPSVTSSEGQLGTEFALLLRALLGHLSSAPAPAPAPALAPIPAPAVVAPPAPELSPVEAMAAARDRPYEAYQRTLERRKQLQDAKANYIAEKERYRDEKKLVREEKEKYRQEREIQEQRMKEEREKERERKAIERRKARRQLYDMRGKYPVLDQKAALSHRIASRRSAPTGVTEIPSSWLRPTMRGGILAPVPVYNEFEGDDGRLRRRVHGLFARGGDQGDVDSSVTPQTPPRSLAHSHKTSSQTSRPAVPLPARKASKVSLSNQGDRGSLQDSLSRVLERMGTMGFVDSQHLTQLFFTHLGKDGLNLYTMTRDAPLSKAEEDEMFEWLLEKQIATQRGSPDFGMNANLGGNVEVRSRPLSVLSPSNSIRGMHNMYSL